MNTYLVPGAKGPRRLASLQASNTPQGPRKKTQNVKMYKNVNTCVIYENIYMNTYLVPGAKGPHRLASLQASNTPQGPRKKNTKCENV